MKKLFVSTFIVFGLLTISNAQQFKLTDRLVTPGIGFGSILYTGTGYSTFLPPVSISYEQGLLSDIGPGLIGIGGYVGITGSTWEMVGQSFNYGYRYSSVIIGGRGYYHVDLVDELDTYAGFMLGYNMVLSHEFGDWPSAVSVPVVNGGISFALFAGARYYFQNKLGVMAELGYGISYLTVGIAYKI